MRAEPVGLPDRKKASMSFADNILDSVRAGDWGRLGELIGDKGEYLTRDGLNEKEFFDLLKILQVSKSPRFIDLFKGLIKNDLIMDQFSEAQMDELSTHNPNQFLFSIDLTRLSSNRLDELGTQYADDSDMSSKIQRAMKAKEEAKLVRRWWCIVL